MNVSGLLTMQQHTKIKIYISTVCSTLLPEIQMSHFAPTNKCFSIGGFRVQHDQMQQEENEGRGS